MKPLFQSILFFVLSLSVLSCNDDENPPKNITYHEFVWTIDTIGNIGNECTGVTIIDKDNYWLVGDFYDPKNDKFYNIAKCMNGKWSFDRLSNDTYTLRSINAVSVSDIWIGGVFPYKATTDGWKMFDSVDGYPNNFGAINQIVPLSKNNIYFTGNNGSLVKWDGLKFTNLSIQSNKLFNSFTGLSNGSKLWGIMVRDSSGYLITDLIESTGDPKKWNTIYSGMSGTGQPHNPNELSNKVFKITAAGNRYLHVVSSYGIYRLNSTDKKVTNFYHWPVSYEWFPVSMGVQSENDIITGHHGGTINYFNGEKIQSIYRKNEGIFNALDYKNNTIIAVKGFLYGLIVLKGVSIN